MYRREPAGRSVSLGACIDTSAPRVLIFIERFRRCAVNIEHGARIISLLNSRGRARPRGSEEDHLARRKSSSGQAGTHGSVSSFFVRHEITLGDHRR